MKNRFVLRFTCIAIAIIISVAFFACDTAETGTEKATEEITNQVTDKVADQTTEKPTEATTEETMEDKTAENTSTEGETGNDAQLAKDFTVYDAEGNKVKLSDFFGKPIVLNFWASWCGPCRSEMPEFNKKYLEIGDEVQFLMINLTASDSIEDANDFIESNGYSFPILYDKNYSATNAYSIYYIPMTVFIDSDGYIVATETGAIDAEMLDERIGLIK